MAGKDANPLEGVPLAGLKYLERRFPLLGRLRPAGCPRDKAGNRGLFFDHYGSLILLFFFNPLLPSLRAIQ